MNQPQFQVNISFHDRSRPTLRTLSDMHNFIKCFCELSLSHICLPKITTEIRVLEGFFVANCWLRVGHTYFDAKLFHAPIQHITIIKALSHGRTILHSNT
jgi:hypothetical protein